MEYFEIRLFLLHFYYYLAYQSEENQNLIVSLQREIKSCLSSKLMHNAEIRTIAKPLPLLRRETHKMLILSYSV